MVKRVYLFGEGCTEGNAEMKNLLGGKGANLAEMSIIGIPVPAGFTITTEACNEYHTNNNIIPEGLEGEVDLALKRVEDTMKAKFGDEHNPLLVSVRSGSRVSMPGMLDTVLNIGLNDKTIIGIINKSNNERFAWDTYRRFIQMYGNVVMSIKPLSNDNFDPFEEIIDDIKRLKGIDSDLELSIDDLKKIVERFKGMICKRLGKELPSDPYEQLWEAIKSVFKSWNNDRAILYRRLNNIDDDWGTGVNVQAMVFGNMGKDSASGVAFTRNPVNGNNELYGEYLINAQGEDVVAGIRTPQQITLAGSLEWSKANNIGEEERNSKYISLEEYKNDIYREFIDIIKKLENRFLDMQDIEFTIQNNKLWMLQTRTGKRTAEAAVRIAVEMVKEGLIQKEEALMRIEPNSIEQLLHPIFSPKAARKVITKGLPSSPGAATGRVIFNADDAEKYTTIGDDVILVRIDTSPEDLKGMSLAKGILTARGGMTSHAAVVSRGMGKCCVSGCGELEINYAKREMKVKDIIIKEGDYISIDGSNGDVMVGQVPTEEAQLSGNFEIIMKWADEVKRLNIRTNADSPHDAEIARSFGAKGIGLCRTEHMFFEEDRIKVMRKMILSHDLEGRKRALNELLPMQRQDFYGILKAMEGFSVTIRLLDPPLHEFLPHEDYNQRKMAEEMGTSSEIIKAKVDSLYEFNPMLGHRGCRLGITYPEITEMQSRAVFEAACQLVKEGIDVKPEIMVPLVSNVNEFLQEKMVIEKTAEKVMKELMVRVDYLIGTMIEVPRAAITADEIANEAAFFSFGTNDLTQMTYGFSRDDSGKFLNEYIDKKILAHNPFKELDRDGVGQLIKIAIEKGRSVNSELDVGICGEHGGEPNSIEFCHIVGMDYVSCSPFRTPVARLAAAQAAIMNN
ncbi:MAG: pyruvate, phosphate dikinase [Spirochaetota bacterium]|nr:pyruvate, phosphate dikinase [Spirochaetota bacterium]